jgi:hypothetical protein
MSRPDPVALFHRPPFHRRISLDTVHLRCAGLSIKESDTGFLLQIEEPQNRRKRHGGAKHSRKDPQQRSRYPGR